MKQLEDAIKGLETQKTALMGTLADMDSAIGALKRLTEGQTIAETNGARKTLSAAGRRAIAAGQKKRWAAFRKKGKK